MKLLFKADCYKRGELIHAKGDIKEISEKNGTAQHYIKRFLAEEVSGKQAEAKPKKEDKKVVEKEEKKIEIPEVEKISEAGYDSL